MSLYLASGVAYVPCLRMGTSFVSSARQVKLDG